MEPVTRGIPGANGGTGSVKKLDFLAGQALNALSAHLAILDDDGTIVAVNRAWREFAALNSLAESTTNVCEGTNYLRVCEDAFGPWSEEAASVAVGIRAVLSGQQSEFEIEYPCHSPHEKRWFIARVTRFSAAGGERVVVAHENITARKQAEEELRASKAELETFNHQLETAISRANEMAVQAVATEMVLAERERSLNEAQYLAHVGSWRHDFGTGETTWSQQMFRILGRDQSLGVPSWQEIGEMVHPADRERFETSIEMALVMQSPHELEFRTLHPDGQTQWLKMIAGKTTACAGESEWISGTFQDITEGKSREDALRFSNTLLATQQETTLDGILVVNEAMQILSYNQRFVEMWRVPKELIEGSDDTLVLAHNLDQTADPAWFLARIQYLSERRSESSADRITLKTGEIFEMHTAPMIGPENQCYGTVCYYRDVTAARSAERTLQASESKLADASRIAKLGSWEYDVAADLFTFNDQVYETIGTTAAREGGYTMSADQMTIRIVHPADRGLIGPAIQMALDTKDADYRTQFDLRTLSASGETRCLTVHIRVVKDGHGRTINIYGVTLDITERARTEETLRESEARYRAVTESANDAIVTSDANGSIVGWNQGAERIFGYSESEISGQPLTVLMPQRSQAAHSDAFEMAAMSRSACAASKTVEVTGQRKDNSEFPLELSLSKWDVNGSLHFTAIIRDITERKAMEERMAHQANHDSLTNLPNRLLFQDRLTQALARRARSDKQVAVMFIDLDNFKLINDGLGHTAGDTLLQCVAERIQNSLRGADTAARFGGDEFTILAEGVEDDADACVVAKRIMAQFQHPLTLATREVFVNASIGVAVSSDSMDNPIRLMRNADAAMYVAKGRGGGRYEVFDDRMNTHALQRIELEHELHRAAENDELILHYQPVISLASGAITGFEALVRWNHPTRGIISPLDFVPLAEETGLILPVGRWVLAEACRQMQVWSARHSAASGMYVAVNLSARQFQQPSLVGDVASALEECGLPPSCLTLEITESVIMEETEFTLATLGALKSTGLRIAIDDFGTGYSSLSYLRRFPVDYLKIDRSFIDGLDKGDEDRLIVSSTIGLAHSLGLSVIAEGAESIQQVSLLRSLSCDNVQGYYFHPPLPASDIETLLASGTGHDLPAPHAASDQPFERERDSALVRAAVDLHRIRNTSSAYAKAGDVGGVTPA